MNPLIFAHVCPVILLLSNDFTFNYDKLVTCNPSALYSVTAQVTTKILLDTKLMTVRHKAQRIYM